MRAVLRSDDEDKTLDATIGIEALLLGDNDREEVTHRMAQRAATALSTDDYSPEVIFQLLKKVYAHRSAIVHGRTTQKETIALDGKMFLTRNIAEFLLRDLLMNYLLADKPWTLADLDARLLRALSRPDSG